MMSHTLGALAGLALILTPLAVVAAFLHRWFS